MALIGRTGIELAKSISANIDVVVKLKAREPKIPKITLITKPYKLY